MFYSTVEIAGESNHTIVALLVYMVGIAPASYRQVPTYFSDVYKTSQVSTYIGNILNF